MLTFAVGLHNWFYDSHKHETGVELKQIINFGCNNIVSGKGVGDWTGDG
jgi:hypothetical protein